MKKKYLVFADRAGIYLENFAGPDVEEWTSDKSKARQFETLREIGEIMKALKKSSFYQKDGDFKIIPIESKKEMQDFRVTLYHNQNFLREELISAYDALDAWNEALIRYKGGGREIISTKIELRPKKVRTPEQHDNIRCEKSL
jgi:hypothetical protein